MKKLLLILIFLYPLICFSQTRDTLNVSFRGITINGKFYPNNTIILYCLPDSVSAEVLFTPIATQPPYFNPLISNVVVPAKRDTFYINGSTGLKFTSINSLINWFAENSVDPIGYDTSAIHNGLNTFNPLMQIYNSGFPAEFSGNTVDLGYRSGSLIDSDFLNFIHINALGMYFNYLGYDSLSDSVLTITNGRIEKMDISSIFSNNKHPFFAKKDSTYANYHYNYWIGNGSNPSTYYGGGGSNVFVGDSVGYGVGFGEVGIGGRNFMTPSTSVNLVYNTAIGYESQQHSTYTNNFANSGNYGGKNTSVGAGSLSNCLSCGQNSIYGVAAAQNDKYGSGMAIYGYNALNLYNDSSVLNAGFALFGYNVASALMFGQHLSIVGSNSARYFKYAQNTVGIGDNVGGDHDTSINNTFIGDYANETNENRDSNVTARYRIAIGANSYTTKDSFATIGDKYGALKGVAIGNALGYSTAMLEVEGNSNTDTIFSSENSSGSCIFYTRANGSVGINGSLFLTNLSNTVSAGDSTIIINTSGQIKKGRPSLANLRDTSTIGVTTRGLNVYIGPGSLFGTMANFTSFCTINNITISSSGVYFSSPGLGSMNPTANGLIFSRTVADLINPTAKIQNSGKLALVVSGNGTINELSIDTAGHIISGGSAPTISAGVGAGTSPTVSIYGHDIAHNITITTGTLPTLLSVVATVTFHTAFTVSPIVILTPANINAAALSGASMVYIPATTLTNGVTTTTYNLVCGTALSGSTTYVWSVQIIQ